MGSRANRVPLDKAEFHLIPPAYGEYYAEGIIDDPEIPNMQRMYKDCHETVYGKPCASTDRLAPCAKDIIDGARRAGCSLRLYFLANMVGHRAHQQTIIDHTDRTKGVRFTAKKLVGKIAEKRVAMYAELCRKDFGTFNIQVLGALTNKNLEHDSLEYRMQTSELTVGQFIVDWKISNGGPALECLYIDKELALDPVWLATESTYRPLVLDPYLKNRHGSEAIQRHRFDVVQSIAYLKKHHDAAILAYRTREQSMPKTIEEVLRLFGFRPDHFEILNKPQTSTLEFWSAIGRAIQCYHCLRFYQGESSVFNR
jgi:hypothetical protein